MLLIRYYNHVSNQIIDIWGIDDPEVEESLIQLLLEKVCVSLKYYLSLNLNML